MLPYCTYITAVLELRVVSSVQIHALGVAVCFVVSSCNSKFNVSDLSAQRLGDHSIVKFSDPRLPHAGFLATRQALLSIERRAHLRIVKPRAHYLLF